ncbi:MAG: ATP-dependent Clp protease proteolytic subunit [Clostridia bacterium]|nr:ATP-dependent Clp protease proteolytic subunit [Clostridia bacterium]
MNTVMKAMPADVPYVPQIPEAVRTIIVRQNPGLPMPDLVSYYVLENDRKLYLDGDVDNNILNQQRMILRWNMEDAGKPEEERRPIYLYIFSTGGDVDVMWSLVDAIETSETPVYTVNMGVAASAAGIIYLAGHKRFMMPRSRLVIHEGSACMAGDAVKVMDASESYKRMIRQMKDYIISKTKISSATLNRQRCHDWELDATYCLEHGACEKVVNSIADVL